MLSPQLIQSLPRHFERFRRAPCPVTFFTVMELYNGVDKVTRRQPEYIRMMTRRELLAGAAAVAAHGAVSGGIVDTHVHFYDPARRGGVPWPAKTDKVLYKTTLPDGYAELVKPLGVTGCVAIEASPLVSDNRWLLDVAKTNGIVLAVIGNLDPNDSKFQNNFENFAQNRSYRGIRFNADRLRNLAANSQALDRISLLNERDLTVDVLGEGSAFLTDVLRLCDRFPKLKIVIDHLPFRDEQNALGEFRGRAAVFAKLSGVPRKVHGRVPDGVDAYREELDCVWAIFGEDRALYASNWPVSNLVAPYAAVLKVQQNYMKTKSEMAQRKYFRENAKRAYGWV